MNADRWRRIEEVWWRALELPEPEQVAFLEEVGQGEPEILAEVRSLLAVHDRVDDFLEDVAVDQLPDWSTCLARDNESGRRMGPYQLLDKIGRGGMATVYLAQRADAEYEQKVALKILKRGLDTDNVLRRFRSERQILARLNHENIAKIFDGGTTEDGRPYFVMEHVKGTSIDAYCTRRPSLDERLTLFRQVCSAVHFAHQNLIVHRDIKPGNILVTPEGVPKLLDFGIAKLLAPEEFPQAVATTRADLQPMTPQYASPEQLLGEHITTASDIYSLGMLLHKILTGRLPTERQPPTPTRLPGELEKIVHMALREEPERRYASAEQFSEDLRHYLEGQPVRAQRDTWRYRAGKFVRRHRGAVAVVAVVVALVAGFVVALSWQVAEARREHDRAELEREKAEEVSTVLFDLFESVDPAQARGETITARELLERSVERIEQDLVGQEPLRAATLEIIGQVYQRLGLYDRALPLLETSLELRQKVLGDDHPDVADSLVHLGDLLSNTGELSRAEELLRQALAIQRAIYGADHLEVADTLGYLTIVLWRMGRSEEAEKNQRQALAIQREHLSEDDLPVAVSLGNLGNVLFDRGRISEAQELTRKSLAVRRRIQGTTHPDVLTLTNNLADTLAKQGRYEAAEPLYREILATRRKIFAPDHPDVARAMHSLGGTLAARGKFEEAEDLLYAALTLRRKLLPGQDTVALATSLTMLAFLRRSQGDLQGAVQFLEEGLEVGRKAVPAGHPGLAYGLSDLGEVLLEMKDFQGAEPVLREAYEIRQQALPVASPLITESAMALGTCLAALGEFMEAEEHLLASHLVLVDEDQPEALERCRRHLVVLYEAWDKPQEARRYRVLLESSDRTHPAR